MFLQKQKLVHFKRFETDLRYKLRLLQWNPSKMNQYCARHETRSYWNHASIDRTRCIENRKGFNRRPQWPETLQPVSKMRLSAQALRPPPPESKPKQISSQRKGVPSPPIHYETSKSEESASRNAAGVQLLSRSLHAQIFRHTAPSTSNQKSETISLTHLKNHGLDPDNTQVLPNISFTLPPLEGSNVDEHFYNMGARLAEQTRCLAVNLANNNVPPQPLESVWQHCSGWTKYTRDADGRIVTESGVGPYNEPMLVFDVETMPPYHQYAVMACAASPTAWYCWISPWLLGESEEAKHLISLGPPSACGQQRIVVGHNVCYDRARVLEEYHVGCDSGIRWIDTMSLHVAVKGISSVQRPAWTAWRKAKDKEEAQSKSEYNVQESLRHLSPLSNERLIAEMEAEMVLERRGDSEEESDPQFERWESITATNSLLEVARLYCGIAMNKETRNAFMSDTPEAIRKDLAKYLSYCASDVFTTHAVFQKVLPLFLKACPHPVSWVGIMRMGSSILTVNQEWERYLERAEDKYRELEGNVKRRLVEVAEATKELMSSGVWANDVFLQQMDWSPKLAGKSRGYWVPTQKELKAFQKRSAANADKANEDLSMPHWFLDLKADPISPYSRHVVIPLLLKPKLRGREMFYTKKHGWLYRNPHQNLVFDEDVPLKNPKTGEAKAFIKDGTTLVQPAPLSKLKGTDDSVFWSENVVTPLLEEGILRIPGSGLAKSLLASKFKQRDIDLLMELARKTALDPVEKRPLALSVLDWSVPSSGTRGKKRPKSTPKKEPLPVKDIPLPCSSHPSLPPGLAPPDGLNYPSPIWPKWYWDLAKPRKDAPRGSIDVTVRNRLTPLLLRLGWLDHPLVYSREHGWCYRSPATSLPILSDDASGCEEMPTARHEGTGSSSDVEKISPLVFGHKDDELLRKQSHEGYQFFKLPHPHGQSANVGNPLSKSFIKYAQDGTLKSIEHDSASQAEVVKTTAIAVDQAKNALDMNAQCSYWISARDRVLNQMVVWEHTNGDLGIGNADSARMEGEEKWGIILPQVITMGTVTRRAIEKTWLTASNAKKNRVGSELKAMVRAPPGYAIVGADVDSEELWISSLMGDAQFGMHGATAIGWMTLEGTKTDGTDLHSKTASILGISRNDAKVFNYSRIYGAGMRHAILLLRQANASMSLNEAQELAQKLYASTKGKNTYTTEYFGRKFWHGGTESFLFNKLEYIAQSKEPVTPALECRVTTALRKQHLSDEFGSDYLTSRINWVVQSSGVDYLHLLIASMEHLIEKYAIKARYMISVHDEVRYLVKEDDKYRAAMALQIANLWTRSLFSYKLGFDDLPVSVAFFSALDVDLVLRKEVDMPCITPSQPIPIPPGESLQINVLLDKTNNGSLHPDGRPMEVWHNRKEEPPPAPGYVPGKPMAHRSECLEFLDAQSTEQIDLVKAQSRQWAQKLKKDGRGAEVTSWGAKKYKKRGRKLKEEFSGDAETVGPSSDQATLDDL